MRTILALFTASSLALLPGVVACDREGEETGETTEAMEDITVQEEDDLVDDIGEGLEETGEAIEEGAEETGEAIEEAAEETGEAIEEAAEEVNP